MEPKYKIFGGSEKKQRFLICCHLIITYSQGWKVFEKETTWRRKKMQPGFSEGRSYSSVWGIQRVIRGSLGKTWGRMRQGWVKQMREEEWNCRNIYTFFPRWQNRKITVFIGTQTSAELGVMCFYQLTQIFQKYNAVLFSICVAAKIILVIFSFLAHITLHWIE